MALTNQQILDALEAAIAAILDGGVVSYQINGRIATMLDLAALMKQRQEMLAAVDREKNGAFAVALFRRPR